MGSDVKEEFADCHRDIWDNAFKWAVVRNPFDKTVSAWKYLQATKSLALGDVLSAPPSRDDSISDHHHFTASQFELLAIDGRLIVDRFLHYETLDTDLRELFSELGLPYKGLPQLNRTPGRSNRDLDALDDEVVAAIADQFATDFTSFGYSFDVLKNAPETAKQ